MGLFSKDPQKAWDNNIAALRKRKDPLDHALAEQQEKCSRNPRNGGTGQGRALFPTVEKQRGRH